MSRRGIQYPEIVDLVTQAKDGTVRLILAETEPINGDRILALQKKLKNYLSCTISEREGCSCSDSSGSVCSARCSRP